MKKGLLLLLLISSVFAHGQSLKEALYGGKLKSKPGTVIRKGDDLTKLDTTTQVDSTSLIAATDSLASDSAKRKLIALTGDSATNNLTVPTDKTAITDMDKKDSISGVTDSEAPEATENAAKENTPAPKNNNVLWKEYVDTVASTLKAEVLPSKKIKRETYYITVTYVIGTDGQVEVTDVAVSPENSFLQQQVKDRLTVDAPRLNPVLSSTGTPRKSNKRYNFTLTKE